MTNIFKNRQNLICFIKYGLVGTSGAVIDLGLLYLLVEFLNFNPVVAGSISFILAVVNNFYWNKIWTFENTSKDYGKQFGKFLLVSLAGLGLTAILMYLGVEVLRLW
ncbi:MAG: GtrA family protein, partial [Patescibacteria group bacterium]